MRTLIVFCMLLLSTSIAFADGVQPEGSGTENSPYQIATLDNLLWLSTTPESWESHFIQTADIDASDTENWNGGEGFLPIGTDGEFKGIYNGQNHSIEDICIRRNTSVNTGLFAKTERAEISFVKLLNVEIMGNNKSGGLAGMCWVTEITHCKVTGSVTGENNVGGLVGLMSMYTMVDSCHFSGEVNGCTNVGGFTGIILGTVAY